MESLGLNTIKSFLKKNVNLHLKDGAVIINVQLAAIRKDSFGKETLIECIPYRNRKTVSVPLKSIAWAELLNLNFIQTIN